MATYMHAPLLGMPRPVHAQEKPAKRARRELAEWAARNPIRIGQDGSPTRIPLTRAEVVTSYVHPEPEIPQHRIVTADLTGSAKTFALACREAGYQVAVTAWRGTTSPRWTVPKETPVDARDYHGDVRDFVQVWVVTVDGRRIRASWANGRFSSAYVGNRWVATLTEAQGALS
jgi:hypothetical protein